MVAANLVSFGLYPAVVKRVSEKNPEARRFTSGGLILLDGVDRRRQLISVRGMTAVVYALKLQLGGALGWVRITFLIVVSAETYFAGLLLLSKRICLDAIGVIRDLRNEGLP